MGSKRIESCKIFDADASLGWVAMVFDGKRWLAKWVADEGQEEAALARFREAQPSRFGPRPMGQLTGGDEEGRSKDRVLLARLFSDDGEYLGSGGEIPGWLVETAVGSGIATPPKGLIDAAVECARLDAACLPGRGRTGPKL